MQFQPILRLFQMSLIKIFLLSDSTNAQGINDSFNEDLRSFLSKSRYFLLEAGKATNGQDEQGFLIILKNIMKDTALEDQLASTTSVVEFCQRFLVEIKNLAQEKCHLTLETEKEITECTGALPDCIGYVELYFEFETSNNDIIADAPLEQAILKLSEKNYLGAQEYICQKRKQGSNKYIQTLEDQLERLVMKVVLAHTSTDKAKSTVNEVVKNNAIKKLETAIDDIVNAEDILNNCRQSKFSDRSANFFSHFDNDLDETLIDLKSKVILAFIEDSLPTKSKPDNALYRTIHIIQELYGRSLFDQAHIRDVRSDEAYFSLPKLNEFMHSSGVRKKLTEKLMDLFASLLALPESKDSNEEGITQSDHKKIADFKVLLADVSIKSRTDSNSFAMLSINRFLAEEAAHKQSTTTTHPRAPAI